MKNRFSLVCRGSRGGLFYSYDSVTKKRESLKTTDRTEAERLLVAKNEAVQQSQMNMQLAQVYLRHSDCELAKRTWQNVMDTMTPLKTGATQERWKHAIADKAFNIIRDRKLIETTGEQFFAVLRAGSISTNVFLRRLHNFALSMQWLPWPVLPKRQWPTVKYKEKRAITREEHEKIVARENNPATKAYYQLLWHLGGSQSDIALLNAEDINWKDRTISYSRRKTGVPVIVSFGEETAGILRTLPQSGQLFPALARIPEKHRAKMFIKRLKTVNVSGVSLHCYRYAWAERAKTVGMPERFAQQALGHSSKAFARAYSRKALFVVPSLEEYEAKVIPMPQNVEQRPNVAATA